VLSAKLSYSDVRHCHLPVIKATQIGPLCEFAKCNFWIEDSNDNATGFLCSVSQRLPEDMNKALQFSSKQQTCSK
jgi:hypothetical protein